VSEDLLYLKVAAFGAFTHSRFQELHLFEFRVVVKGSDRLHEQQPEQHAMH
jgi:hypothetical protein